MFTHLKRTLTTGALVASLATGTLAGAAHAEPAGLDRGVDSAAAQSAYDYQASKYKFKYIKQDQGQETQWVDCGPTSILMALLDNGGEVPASYNEKDQSAAILELRAEAPSGGEEGTNFFYDSDVSTILKNRGVSGTVLGTGKAITALDGLKQGQKAVVLTQTDMLRDGKTDPGFGHFVYVSGYNPSTGTYTVNDPLNNDERSYEATEDEMRTMLTSPAKGNQEWVYLI
ncbi:MULTISPECIES: C39 family peptidase [unclassified Corynebacterium]|uniref:C39 family peptidase n=1 Tax=unclassified Corynebacterium TaxID=2624378 RepID=UPI0029C9F443|nr:MULTISPECIES: C39 family peptidase [unclassified Corynebacterium]WPF66211.1 C39 family peptidase [Corynebacterium sp. 22KM0430]WPF68702.1 C39 family peptidase [Corynebacterium sp. 21KM1197]